jgi:predicted ATPase
LSEALTHIETGLAMHDATVHPATASTFGNHDASICARSFGAVSLALLGDEARARAMTHDALALAGRLKDPFSLALAHYFASATGQMLGDLELAAANADAAMQVSTEHGFALTKAWSAGIAGWCAAARGELDRGVTLLADAIAALGDMQAMAYKSYLLGLLADASLKAGRRAPAMTAVTDAIAAAEATGERFFLAELHRLKGELLAHPSLGRPEDAADAFRTAIAIARRQNARLLERKAEASLRRSVA